MELKPIVELVSAPLNAVPVEEQFRWSHPLSELSNLGILLMNSNCFAIFFSNILVMSVQIFIFIRNSVGPRSEPCGTPYLKGKMFELTPSTQH